MRVKKENAIKKPSGGSALKQLKTNLKTLGLIQARKPSRQVRTKSEKEERVEKLNKLKNEVNPFELKFNRQKHDVLGRKIKGAVGNPGASKKRGYENVSTS